MLPLDGAKGISLQNNLQNLRVLLVDERSLIGANTLGWMEWRCRSSMTNNTEFQSWGGIPVVVFMGDDIQLPPVLDSPVYHCTSNSPASIHGTLVWNEFDQCVILNTIVRQQGEDEKALREVLTSLRNYSTTSTQVQWLQQFQWQDLQVTHGEDLTMKMSQEALYIFPTRAEEWSHNKSKLIQMNQIYPVATLHAQFQGPHSQSTPDDKASGLPKIVFICKKAKVTLTVNINVSCGLFNRATGTVEDIIFLNGKSPKDSLPDVVMVNFPSYSGPPFIPSHPTVVPLLPVQRVMDCACGGCKRTQIPLRLGWGSTLHSCQGITVGDGESSRYIVINPGTKAFESRNPGALFLALSRAKSSGTKNRDPDFAWHPDILVNEE
jgi:hypothetical protein